MMLMPRREVSSQGCAKLVAPWRCPKGLSLGCRRPNLSAFLPRLRLPRTSLDSSLVVCSAVEPFSDAEANANAKRWEESGRQGDSDEWRWSLNWDEIEENVLVGSCPRSPGDLDTIVEEAGATAVLSLQSDICLDALNIDGEAIQARGAQKGVAMLRVPIRDFDHGDQTLMLPEAVRTLAMLLALKHKVYVHCTAGINRATLTVLGYLTFVKGWELHSAVDFIKSTRPQAHPYLDCWKSTKARLLQGRKDEVAAVAKTLTKDSFSNWVEAENNLIQETFQRQLACNLLVVQSMAVSKPAKTVSKTAKTVSSACTMPEELEKAQAEMSTPKQHLEEEREEGSKYESCEAAFAELAEAYDEIAALRQGILDIGETSSRALHEQPPMKDSSINHKTRAENPMSDIGPTTSL